MQYIEKLPEFEIATEIDGNYQNMGATIIDGILQAGIKYETVVKPRVKKFLSMYPKITTTKKFKSLIDKVSVPALIDWKESSKTRIIRNLTEFLINENVDTESEFKDWLKNDDNIEKLKHISGIKDKTADYFKILTGHNTNAIDRHLISFLENAGIQIKNYQEAQSIISETAKLLHIQESYFDHTLWKYMSESKKQNLKQANILKESSNAVCRHSCRK